MRIETVSLGQSNHTRAAFRAKEVYDWANDPDLSTPKQDFDRFVSALEDEKTPEERFDADIEKIFEERDSIEPASVFVLENYNTDKNRPKTKITFEGVAALAAAFYVMCAAVFGTAMLLKNFSDSFRQKELESRFKENPGVVAEELIKGLEFDDTAITSLFNPYHLESSGYEILEAKDGSASQNLPLGPQSKIQYDIKSFLSLSGGTAYSAKLDIDGDGYPEITIKTSGSGLVDVLFDYDSDGTIDSHAVYDKHIIEALKDNTEGDLNMLSGNIG